MLERINNLCRTADQSRIYDWAMRLPAFVYASFVLGVSAFTFSMQLSGVAVFPADGLFVLSMLAKLSQWLTLVLLAALPIIRWRPITKSPSLLARGSALIAVVLPLSFAHLGRAPASMVFNILSIALALMAGALSILSLAYLGRSFSVMPEARRLVTNGPYAFVRHPLYLAEMLGVTGIVLQYRSPSAAGLFLVILILQVARARWEEEVLARTFPEFDAYQRSTPILIPRALSRISQRYSLATGFKN